MKVEGKEMYSSTFSLTSALEGGVCKATPRSIYRRELHCTHCIEKWMGIRAGLDGSGKPRPH